MPIGSQATVQGLNGTLSSLAVQTRNLMQQVRTLQEYAVTTGLTGLQNLGGTGAGFGAADAQAYLNMVSTLNTVAGVFFGTATQATLFSFDNAVSGTYAGQ